MLTLKPEGCSIETAHVLFHYGLSEDNYNGGIKIMMSNGAILMECARLEHHGNVSSNTPEGKQRVISDIWAY